MFDCQENDKNSPNFPYFVKKLTDKNGECLRDLIVKKIKKTFYAKYFSNKDWQMGNVFWKESF